ncbi:mannosyltransferase family protein [Nonomuraea sp. NPDC046570]|uniref:mannosyltransferase family protein n=1 Tax=Nonomuraea sp. NPDC046570 TaxID=3155255 RepID=UPI0033C8B0C7
MTTRSTTGDALLIWLCSRLGLLLSGVLGVSFLVKEGEQLDRWRQWDTTLFIEIAKYGYAGDPAEPEDPGLPAFFPGLPALLRLLHTVVPDWTVCGLIVSLVAGAVAAVALARLAEFEGPAGAGWPAVLALVLFPTAVFLTAGYSESLFLALAIPAWLAARKRQWPLAVLLAAGASTVRITGLFLAVALIVEFALSRPRLRQAPWLLVPFLPLIAYSFYLYTRTGDLLAWKGAQEAGWGRKMVWPWEAWNTTWGTAIGSGDSAVAFRMEIVGAVVAVAVLLWLLARRRWSEFVYVGLQAGALMTSAYYLSIPRSLLLWFPLWVAIGQLAARRRWVIIGYALVLGPLMMLNGLRFLTGAWAG